MIIAQSMVRGSAIPSKIDFARAVYVRNSLEDVHDKTVVNYAVVRIEGGIPPMINNCCGLLFKKE